MHSISVLGNNTISSDNLKVIFHPENAIACANYGGGTHCNEVSISRKLNIWGKNSEGKSDNSCVAAKIFSVDSEPAGLFNIGFTGNPATVKDIKGNSSVYEFSGLIVRDKFIESGLSEISTAVKDFMRSCEAGEGYTKAIVTFAIDHPYQQDFLTSAGGIIATKDNIEQELGINALHPERFRFDGEQFQECSQWNRESTISYEGWHDSSPCSKWSDKTMMLFGINEGKISSFDTDL